MKQAMKTMMFWTSSVQQYFLLRLLTRAIACEKFFGCRMWFEFDSSSHTDFLLKLSFYCKLVLKTI
jgi:hypothetical protein